MSKIEILKEEQLLESEKTYFEKRAEYENLYPFKNYTEFINALLSYTNLLHKEAMIVRDRRHQYRQKNFLKRNLMLSSEHLIDLRRNQ